MPYGIPPSALGQLQPQPQDETALAASLGIAPPQLDTSTDPSFQTTPYQSFLENFAGLEQQPMESHNFAQGLLAGLSGGLGRRGTRIARERAKFDEAAAERAKERARANLEASRDYRNRLAEGKSKLATEERQRLQKKADEADQRAYESSPQYYEQQKQLAQARAAGQTGTGGEGALTQLTPQGLDAAALMYAKTGQLPPMGIGKATAGVRTKIINRAAEIDPNLDIASNKAGFETNKSALSNLKRIHNASKAFEQTALKNADVLEGTLKKLADTGSPWLNRPMRSLQKGVGDPSVTSFRTALETVAPEFARLLNSPTASGQLSDTARQEIRNILDPNATPSQIRAALTILRQDAHNRTTSYAEQIQSLEGEISRKPGQERPLGTFTRGPDGKLVLGAR